MVGKNNKRSRQSTEVARGVEVERSQAILKSLARIA